MEFPRLGAHCSNNSCHKLDFLPIKCDGCHQLFCADHMRYESHSCPSPKRIDNQVAVCPLCGAPVPSKPAHPPDVTVNAHIERDCQSDPAINARKTFFSCSYKRCKNREVVLITCDKCWLNFCVSHRHPTDHKCSNNPVFPPNNEISQNSAIKSIDFTKIQGNMTEDEALAYALALSSQGNSSNNANSNNRSNTASNNNCSLS